MLKRQRFSAPLDGQASSRPAGFFELYREQLKSCWCILPQDSTSEQTGSGGEGGIRTPGTSFSSYNGLANRRIQPLCHLSGDRFQLSTILCVCPVLLLRAINAKSACTDNEFYKAEAPQKSLRSFSFSSSFHLPRAVANHSLLSRASSLRKWSASPRGRRSGRIRLGLYRRGPVSGKRERANNGDWVLAA